MKLRDSEQVVVVHPARKKSLFRNPVGELTITNQRVVFHAGSGKLLVEMDRATVRAEKTPHAKSFVLALRSGNWSERFVLDVQHIDEIVALLAPDEDAPSLSHYKN